MKLVEATQAHIRQLMYWFPDQRSCVFWGGPQFRYPFTEASFYEDIRRDLPSYSLIRNGDELVGFGQYYLRVGHCHLARLAISPLHRGRALGAFLVHELCERGCLELQVNHCSLFVSPDNAPAIHLYSRLGFARASYPEMEPQFKECNYMVVASDVINTRDVAAQPSSGS